MSESDDAMSESESDDVVVGGAGEHGDAVRSRRRQPSAGSDAPEIASARLADGRAWTEFCEALQRAGDTLFGPGSPDSPLEVAEGHRYLLGLVASGVRQALDFADPARPRFFRNPDSGAKWGAENADNQYLWARVDPGTVYRLSGSRGTAFDFLIEVKEGYMQLGDERNFATLSAAELDIDADGRFEILLSQRPQPGRWLALDPDARYIAIRQFFLDWESETPARFTLERVGDAGPPLPLTPADAVHLVDDAGEWIEQSARFWSEWVTQMRQRERRNEIAPARHYVGGADDIRYGNELFRLAEDEALVVETELPRARYWAFQLCNLWFESLDYTDRQTSLNAHQAHVDADGRFRCVVAHRDPGVPNWLDTAGHREGILQYRWIWTETNPLPHARVVPFDAVRDALPSATPHVTPAERRRALRVRRAHIARREPAS